MARRLLLSFLLPLLLLASPALRAAGLSVGLAADVSSLDPHYLNAAPNIAVASHFFETLVAVDKDGQLVPGGSRSQPVYNPANGAALHEVSLADTATVQRAIASAAAWSFAFWIIFVISLNPFFG